MTLILGINAQSNLRVARRSAWLKLPIVASACLVALGTTLSAQAQQASGALPSAEVSGGALEEVVVTAERREENIQTVPITVRHSVRKRCRSAISPT
jgi:outer membrane receptor protein involved in Fe transport